MVHNITTTTVVTRPRETHRYRTVVYDLCASRRRENAGRPITCGCAITVVTKKIFNVTRPNVVACETQTLKCELIGEIIIIIKYNRITCKQNVSERVAAEHCGRVFGAVGGGLDGRRTTASATGAGADCVRRLTARRPETSRRRRGGGVRCGTCARARARVVCRGRGIMCIYVLYIVSVYGFVVDRTTAAAVNIIIL